ncbi:MAG: hypothetical protein CL532_09890 [Aestuariivita sp.]|nr:hypothetical protein [Aestuariivita sp.]
MNMIINQNKVAPGEVETGPPTTPTFDARMLVGKEGICRILLDGTPYVLRITKANKLILTK